MPGERDKASKNPYEPPGAASGNGLPLRSLVWGGVMLVVCVALILYTYLGAIIWLNT